jgi:nucleotidyltransferase/DNA polymerase involved in DNA repair
MQQNGNLSKGEITYGIESVMTISQLDFDFGKMEVIDAVLEAPQPVNFQTALGQEILEKDVGAMRGIGAVTRQKLVQLNIHTIRQLALADTRPLLAEVPSIDGLKQNAKAVRRITNEVLNEIVDREHPFPESFYGSFLYEIAQLSAADIQNQTGKSEENVVIFLDNLTELSQSLLKANEFAALSLADFK